VSEAIQKLEAGDQVAIHTYIAQLKALIADLEVQVAGVTSPAPTRDEDDDNDNDDEQPTMMADATMSEEEVPVATTTANASSVEAEISEPPAPPQYDEASGAEDFDAAGDLKQEAAELKQDKEWGAALEKYTEAVLAAPPSALLLANRAFVLLELDRPRAAIADCNVALSHNPDSAKALRIRGTAYKRLGQYEQARLDLSGSQAIDYDDVAAQDLKFVSQQVLLVEAEQAKKKLAEQTLLQEKLERQRQAEAAERAEQREQEAAEREARASASRGSMPGGMPPGGMGGMGGMGGLMSVLMSDPELKAGLSNPKVMAALSGLMSGPGGPMGIMQNPAKLQELMADPDVGPFLQKVMAKLGGGGMGGMGGMPGMGDMGMPPGGRMNDDDDMPDLDDIPNLD
jgi:suppressor of tumorigenicity protein 13